MNKKKKVVALIIVNLILITSVFIIRNYEMKMTDIKMICGKLMDYKYYDRKISSKDFKQFNYDTTYAEMVEQLGEVNGWYGFGAAWPYYELSDGTYAICYFLSGSNLNGITIVNKAEIQYELLPFRLLEEEQEQKEKDLINAKQMEMNVILDILGIQEWNRHSFPEDSIDTPLGRYSEEELKKYVSDNIKVKIEYFWGGYKEEPYQVLFQIIQLYENSTQIYFSYVGWVEDYAIVDKVYSLDSESENLPISKELKIISTTEDFFQEYVQNFSDIKNIIRIEDT